MTNKTRKEKRMEKDQIVELKEKFQKFSAEMVVKAAKAKDIIQKETSEKYDKIRTETANKLEERKKLKEENELKLLEAKKKEEEREKNVYCKVGAIIHHQKTNYGKGNCFFYFGGFLNEHTISIIAENVMGVRAQSFSYFIQVSEGTKFDLPGLYNDQTGEFKNVALIVKKMDLKSNIISFEKYHTI